MSKGRGLCLIAFATLAAGSAACSSYDFLTDVAAHPPGAADCGACHVEIYEEFHASAHAEAWSRPDFLDATAGHRMTECLGCHAPDTVYAPGAPQLREARRDEGVTCISCHFDGGAMVGPVDSSALVDPHPVAVGRALYRSAELCGKCHEGTYREWLGAPAEGRRTCQECHMERVTRTATQGTGLLSDLLVSFEEAIEGRRHTFHVPVDPVGEDAVTAALAGVLRGPEDLRCDLVLTNALPHPIPTGDYGYRWVRLEIEALAGSGEVLDGRRVSLFKELGEALAPGTPRSFPFTLPPKTAALHVVLDTGKRSGPRATILERTLEIP